jgi:DNA-binding response OmpR family regulator
VDDDRDLADMIAARLSAAGFDVDTAYSGISGLAKIKERIPDLVVLDVMMPQMDGFEVCTLLKEKLGARCPKIILLSAVTAGLSANPEQIRQQSGADAFMAKPYAPPMLLGRINELLGA